MTEEQKRYHEENREIVARIVHKWRRYKFLSDADQRRLMIALQNMRMACNSTYLLDQSTDHGVKIDELCQLLEESFEDPGAKAVIFSQWVRTHELLAQRMQERGWGHVVFHGGVPSPKRKDLVRRFKQDPQCRCFLSTDAGGVGLNLQHANVVINVDQPWNPAVLEQRIARVHRLGQHRPVRVVHLIAQGTIEQGMLSLIDFKKSMFAGALDGGSSEVFLGGTKLTRFMETVDRATDQIPAGMPTQSDEVSTSSYDTNQRDPVAEVLDGPTQGADSVSQALDDFGQNHDTPPSPPQQAWSDFATAAAGCLEKLGRALEASQGSTATENSSNTLNHLITRDKTSGQKVLQIPLPDRQTLKGITDLLQLLTNRL